MKCKLLRFLHSLTSEALLAQRCGLQEAFENFCTMIFTLNIE